MLLIPFIYRLVAAGASVCNVACDVSLTCGFAVQSWHEAITPRRCMGMSVFARKCVCVFV